jgi:hypothetical protein
MGGILANQEMFGTNNLSTQQKEGETVCGTCP